VARSFPAFSVILLLLLTWALGVQAQSAEFTAPPTPDSVASGTVTVSHSRPVALATDRVAYTIRTVTPDRAFDVRAEDDELIARCVGRCTLALPLGSYELRFYDAQGQPERKSSFSVKGSAILEVEDGNPNIAILGAMAGIVGPILATVGSVLVVQSFCGQACSKDSHQTLGFGLIMVGAGMTPLGWITFANHQPRNVEKPFVLPYAASTDDTKGGLIGIRGAF
jgi:hypothetical protein